MKRTLSYLSIGAAIAFLAVGSVLLVLAPEIDPLRLGISSYGLTAYRPVIGVALALVGISGILLAVALWPGSSTTSHKIGCGLLGLWGASSVLAGVFPLDPAGSTPTLAGSIHNIAGLNFLLVVPAVLMIEAADGQASSGTHGRGRALAWLVVAFAAMLFVFNGPLSSLGIGGLVQRLYWVVVVLWLVVTAGRVLRT